MTEQYYLSAAAAYNNRAANKAEKGRQIADWQHRLEHHWDNLRLGEVRIDTRDGQHIIEVQVYVDDINIIRIELYAEGANSDAPVCYEMKRIGELVGAVNGYDYRAIVSANRPVSDYTVRIIPYHKDVAVPLEANHILWQR